VRLDAAWLTRPGHARVAEPDVDVPVCTGCEVGHGLHVLLHRDVGGQAHAADGPRHSLNAVLVDIGHDNLGALRREPAGACLTDATARPGDHDDLALQLHRADLPDPIITIPTR